MIRPIDALRLLYGAVLAVTGLAYFLPDLLPFAAPGAWQDPMAARLMAGFDASGLLAVAKFLHLAGGTLLLLNRLAPFALAATMPVNICGGFIAALIEGDPLLTVLALALIALGGLLMLAHLRYYLPMLAADRLADDEGPGLGEHYNSVLANPFSGAPPRAYVGAAGVLVAALVFYWQVVPFTNGTTGLVTLIWPALMLVIGLGLALVRRAPD